MTDVAQNPHRQQDLYWNQMVELKVACLYQRHYRNYLGHWVTSIGALKAVASSVSIAGWAIWHEYAFVWGFVIAGSQVLDALKDVFPVTKKHKAACEHVLLLESLFIDAQFEWEAIFTGHYPNDEISDRCHKLRKVQHEAEKRNYPDGLPERESDFAAAEEEAKLYFDKTYKL